MQATSSGRKRKGGGSRPRRSAPAKRYFPLLKLPRELQDQIYEHALVVEVLRIHPVSHFDEEEELSFYDKKDRELAPRRPIHKRSTYLIDHPDFRLENSYEYVDLDPPAVSIFQTCRQVYRESACIFYSKNVFFFDDKHRDEFGSGCTRSLRSAVAFFRDRPTCAMNWIKSIKIKLRIAAREEGTDLFGGYFDQWSEEDLDEFSFLVQKTLPALEHFSVMVKGWPPDVRMGRVRQEHPKDRDVTEYGMLLLLPKVKRFSMEILAGIGHGHSEDPGRLVAFAAFIRSHLLKGGEDLGTSRITVHKRHWMKPVRPVDDPQSIVYNRTSDRLFVARCDDDESGKSFLKPVEHPSSFRTSKNHWDQVMGVGLQFRPEHFDLEYSLRTKVGKADEYPDYAESDDGETDSLKDVDLSGYNLEPNDDGSVPE
ncbi:uncharacterized protein J3D65DRAFT_277021 [Phyllosticta citribraziliensis]|uniref:DUF7730 domain-containing protein n=1 Tax=Phyllosticta citribraziliensis TaxID=989973 RepID=A0ABR1LVY4_9PEZI